MAGERVREEAAGPSGGHGGRGGAQDGSAEAAQPPDHGPQAPEGGRDRAATDGEAETSAAGVAGAGDAEADGHGHEADGGDVADVLGDEVAGEPADGDVADAAAEIAALRDRLARARADYDNLQKRVARDAALERDRVKARVLESFLQVYEFGKMAEFEAERSPGPLAEGVKMLVREFDRMLQGEGVQLLGTVGEPFDPRLHEAVAHEEGDVPSGHVSRVVAQGYRLGERVLRYAKVAVAP